MVLSIRRADVVTAAEALGMSRLRIIVRHVLPNTLSFVIVAATLSVPGYILGEVFLSFLGVGVQEPSASWGIDFKASLPCIIGTITTSKNTTPSTSPAM